MQFLKYMVMKTATVTWTSYNNFGTLLQAFALQMTIRRMGYENRILWDGDVLQAYSRQHKKRMSQGKKSVPTVNMNSLDRIKHLISSPAWARRVLLSRTDREKYAQPYYASQAAFDRFRKEDLLIDKNVDLENLELLNERYDAFIAGSDQIWSVFESIFNPYYYLDFAKKRKIAYAPCLGTDKIPESLKPILHALLSDYHAVSVREDVSAKQLSQLTGRTVEWVADPTLLLTREEWAESVKNIKPLVKKRYLLCYFLENRTWYFEKAKELAKKLHLRPVLIPNKWEFLHSEYVIDEAVGPKEFVALFRDADYVLTDSYHGSIFSLIFEKRFQYLQRFDDKDPGSQNIRINSLFHYLGLDKVRVAQEHREVALLEYDYRDVHRKIYEMRNSSLRYLENSLKL